MDVEAELVPLIQALTTYQTATRVPDPRPDRFIQIRRKGGSKAAENASSVAVFRDRPLIDIYVWGPTEDEVQDVSRQVSAYMLTIPRTQPLSETCYRVDESIDEWFDDELDGVSVSPRKWLSYDMNIRFNA